MKNDPFINLETTCGEDKIPDAGTARLESERIFSERLNESIDKCWNHLVERVNLDISVGNSKSKLFLNIPPRFKSQVMKVIRQRLQSLSYSFTEGRIEDDEDTQELLIDWSNVQYPAREVSYDET